jgi:hypothetical protein
MHERVAQKPPAQLPDLQSASSAQRSPASNGAQTIGLQTRLKSPSAQQCPEEHSSPLLHEVPVLPHRSAQRSSQHTFDAQSKDTVQGWPFSRCCRGTHAPLWHFKPLWQPFAGGVQVVWHLPSAQS